MTSDVSTARRLRSLTCGLAAAASFLAAQSAHAQDGGAEPSEGAREARELCPDRPGLGTPPCVLDAGRWQVEVGALSYERDRADGVETDTYRAADLLLRIGLNGTLEAQVGWTPYVSVRVRDEASGESTRFSGAGDLSLSLRQSILRPDGGGVSLAVQPFVTLPTGADGVGDDQAAGGVIVPLSVELSPQAAFSLTQQIDLAGDEDGSGHHLGYTAVAGIGWSAGEVSFAAELAGSIDDDPSGETRRALLGLSAGWTPANLPKVQFDAGVNAGLNDDAPDLEVYAGVTRRF